ncbi:MAG: restriction endonuclease [Polyangia bacterium]
MTNTGKPYEALTEQVFLRLLAQQRLCANVRRNVRMQGKSGVTHQIDVCFDFVAGATTFLAIVQCKDWAFAVKQEQVFAFLSVLEDVPGQPRGIMVARSGFQEGAREFAQTHGIQLYELRDPKDEDWDGLFRTIEIHLTFVMPRYDDVMLFPDIEWLRQECDRLQLPKGQVKVTIDPDHMSFFYESSGLPCDLRRLLSSHAPSGLHDWTPIAFDLSDPLVADLPNGPPPRVRIKSISAKTRMTQHQRTISIKCDHLVAYCFRDVLKGTVQFLDAEGSLLEDKDKDEP